MGHQRLGRRCAPPRPRRCFAACGTSCRHQIADGAKREARHIVRIPDRGVAVGTAAQPLFDRHYGFRGLDDVAGLAMDCCSRRSGPLRLSPSARRA